MELTPWFHRDQSGRREDRLVRKNSSKNCDLVYNFGWTTKLKIKCNQNYIILHMTTDVVYKSSKQGTRKE